MEFIPKEWLNSKISVEEAEATHPGIRDERTPRFPQAAKPFGFQNAEREALKAETKVGDELWSFASPADSWEHLAGRGGIVLLRNGKSIKVIVTIMN
jgi:hypothetical protein